MEYPVFSMDAYSKCKTTSEKSSYLKTLASQLDKYDTYMEGLRNKFISKKPVHTVEVDKNGKTVMKENGLIIGSQG